MLQNTLSASALMLTSDAGSVALNSAIYRRICSSVLRLNCEVTNTRAAVNREVTNTFRSKTDRKIWSSCQEE
ncbi:unnamed protein product [Boreogadus saida]